MWVRHMILAPGFLEKILTQFGILDFECNLSQTFISFSSGIFKTSFVFGIFKCNFIIPGNKNTCPHNVISVLKWKSVRGWAPYKSYSLYRQLVKYIYILQWDITVSSLYIVYSLAIAHIFLNVLLRLSSFATINSHFPLV